MEHQDLGAHQEILTLVVVVVVVVVAVVVETEVVAVEAIIKIGNKYNKIYNHNQRL